MVTSKCWRVLPNGKKKVWFNSSHVSLFNKTSSVRYALNNCVNLWNILFKTSFVKSFPYPFFNRHDMLEDTGAVYFYLARCKNFNSINKCTHYYVQSSSSYSNSSTINLRYNSFLPNLVDLIDKYLTLESEVPNTIISLKDRRNIFNQVCFLFIIYTLSIWFIFPQSFHYEQPPISDWLSYRKSIIDILNKHSIKLRCPKSWWGTISYVLYVNPWFKKSFSKRIKKIIERI
jgi:hypothetical protein